MKEAAFYVRVSTDRQEQEETKETQVNEIQKRIYDDGNTILEKHKYSDEGWSGAYIQRPSLDQLRQDAKNNEFEILYVYDKGRLSRKFVHQELILDELKELGIEFISLHDINAVTPEEAVMSQVMGVFHEYERVKIAERFRLAKLNKVRSGKLLGYNPAYGYNYVPVSGRGFEKKNGHFEINQQEAEVVKKIFEWVGHESISLREVIRRLQQERIKPRKAKRDTWTKSSVVRLLRNETYAGVHYYNKSESVKPKNPVKERKYFKHTDKTSRRMRDKSEWLSIEVPAIVDRSLFNKVQVQLDKNYVYAPRNTKREYLFAGMVYCTCGTKRTGESARGHSYYRCTERLKSFPNPPTCFEKGINSKALDSTGWDKLVILLTEPSLLQKQLDNYIEQVNQNPVDEEQLSSFKKELSSIQDEEKRYISAYGRGSLDESTFDSFMTGTRNRKNVLIGKIQNLENSKPDPLPSVKVEDINDRFIELLKDLEFEDKRHVVKGIVSKVTATKEVVEVCGNIPLSNQEKAGLHGKYRHTDVLTRLPFELKLKMPPTDRGRRGYSTGYVDTLTNHQQFYVFDYTK